jgi:hypothetical protein
MTRGDRNRGVRREKFIHARDSLSLRQSNDPALKGADRRRDSAIDAEFGQYMIDVDLHRAFGDAELRANFFVGLSGDDQLQHLCFPWREVRTPQSTGEPRGHGGIEPVLPLANGADTFKQFTPPASLST